MRTEPDPARMTPADPAGRARIVFLVRVKPGMREDFLRAYEQIRYDVASGVDGHLVDQLCERPDDPDAWLITSEWETLEHFLAWERSPGHQDLMAPMRACIAERESLRFRVVAETRHGDEAR